MHLYRSNLKIVIPPAKQDLLFIQEIARSAIDDDLVIIIKTGSGLIIPNFLLSSSGHRRNLIERIRVRIQRESGTAGVIA